MSKLDQAFIRAYTKDAPAARSATGGVGAFTEVDPAPAAKAAVAAPATTRQAAAPAHRVDAAVATILQGPHGPAQHTKAPLKPAVKPLDPEQVFHLLDAPRYDALPGPHLRIVTVDSVEEAESEPSARGTATPVAAVANESIAAPARVAKLQPAWQVEQFPWPAACDAIARGIAQPLDGLCAELGRYSRLGQKVVCISGCHAGEGRTSLLLLLAKRLAATGLRIAMVDGHFAAPAVASQLGLAPTAGWPELLQQNLPLEESLLESLEDGIALLPLEEPLDYQQVARNPRVWAVVRQLRAAYDLVLIDTAPLGAQSEASFTATPTAMFHPDAAILVRDARATSGAQVQAAVRALRAAGVSTWGIIENFVRG